MGKYVARIPEWAGHQWRGVGESYPIILLSAAIVSKTVGDQEIVAVKALRADLLSTQKWTGRFGRTFYTF